MGWAALYGIAMSREQLEARRLAAAPRPGAVPHGRAAGRAAADAGEGADGLRLEDGRVDGGPRGDAGPHRLRRAVPPEVRGDPPPQARPLLAEARHAGPGEGRGPEADLGPHDVAAAQKKLRAGETLLFVDESGFSPTPYVARTWAPVGRTPVLEHPWGMRDRLSAISGVAVRLRRGRPETDLLFRLHRNEAVNGVRAAAYLRHVARHVRGRVTVLWDNGTAHKGRAVKAFLRAHPRFEAVFLPPYCPELNPDEDVWSWTKTKALRNFCAWDVDHLAGEVRAALQRMKRRKGLLLACLKDTELPWGGLLSQAGGL